MDTTTVAEQSPKQKTKTKIQKKGSSKKPKKKPYLRDPHGTSRIELPQLDDINDKAAYNMWKGCVNYFQTSGATD